MCFRIVIGHEKQDLIAAQWEVVSALQAALDNDWRYREAGQVLRQLLGEARVGDRSPEVCMETFAHSLLVAVAQLQDAIRAADAQAVEQLQAELASYRRIVGELQSRPIRMQVEELAHERDRWREIAGQLTHRVEDLEQALEQAHQTHRADVTQLREEIGDLNRIVAEQQEALTNPPA